MPKKQKFQKPPLSIDQQIDLLQRRGLIIKDKDFAHHFLQFVSYYRLSQYTYTFELKNTDESRTHKFKDNITFQDVVDLYVFDSQLRSHMMNAIERIEIAFRTRLNSIMCMRHGSHWYMNHKLFVDKFNQIEFIEHVNKECGHSAIAGSFKEKKRESFIKHYFNKYDYPSLPPCWMISEILSIGRWSFIFSCIKDRKDQKNISGSFNLHYRILDSWIQSIVYLRNLCAHHSRIWNRTFVISPRIITPMEKYLQNNKTLAAQTTILNYLIKVIIPDAKWTERLITFLKNNQNIKLIEMGFNKSWFSDEFWNYGHKNNDGIKTLKHI
ncbi:Abi family protein [bacterium]|nr:Abi family protein [bacterium]